MNAGAARLTLEDFADATGLPLDALKHPLSQAPLAREPLPCALCEERARAHAEELESATALNAEIVLSLQTSLQNQIEQLRRDMHARQAKAFDAVLSALLPELGQSVLRRRLGEELETALRREDPVTLYIPEGLDVSTVVTDKNCTVTIDPDLPQGAVIVEQANGRTRIDSGRIIKACLAHLNKT